MGSTTIEPGKSTTISVAFSMHEGMGGQHTFQVVVASNDPVQPQQTVEVKAKYPDDKK